MKTFWNAKLLLLTFLFVCFEAAPTLAQSEIESGVAEAQQETDEMDEKSKAFLQKLQGKWQMKTLEMAGRGNAPQDMIDGMSFNFEGDTLECTGFGPNPTDFEFKLMADNDPVQFWFKPIQEDEWVKGIMKIDSDGVLHLCLCQPGTDDERLPKEFDIGDAEDPRMVATMKQEDDE